MLSTYNAPEWLALTLCGYLNQTDKDFEVVIAYDASGGENRELIERFKTTSDLRIQNVWHADAEFQKFTVPNSAIQTPERFQIPLDDKFTTRIAVDKYLGLID